MQTTSNRCCALVLLATCLPAQSDALDGAVREYERAESEDDRIAALEAIATLSDSAPAAEVTASLALGLRDPLPAVRVRAVELVAKAPDRDAALDALVAASRSMIDELESLPKPKLARQPLAAPDISDREEFAEWMEDMQEINERLAEWLEAVDDAMATFEPLVGVFSEIEDDRSVEGLSLLLSLAAVGEKGTPIVEALLNLGTSRALEEVVKGLGHNERHIDGLQKKLRKASRTRARKKPRYWRGTSRAWKDSERRRVAALVAKARKELDAAKAAWESYADLIRGFAEKHDLPEPPSKASASAWSAWARRAGRSLPESLHPDRDG